MIITWLSICPLRGDPMSNMNLTFTSKDDAVAFAEKNGKHHTLLNPIDLPTSASRWFRVTLIH